MTQNERILEYMQAHNGISIYEAFSELGCTCLHGRLAELKKQGYTFSAHPAGGRNRYGEKTHYYRYALEGRPDREPI